MKATCIIATLLLLSGCTEAPKHQIVFIHADTCKIIINDLQYGQANDTERYCELATEKDGKIITINFLSETCNAYRYSFSKARESSEGVYVFKPDNNEPNPQCDFIPQYSDPNAQWVLNPK